MSPWVPLLVMMLIGLGFGVVNIIASNFLGPKNPTAKKDMPYECGIEPIGNARIRFSVKFYLITMLFILFDMEAVFVYPWAVVYKQLARSGLFVFMEMALYLAIIFAGFVYVWKKGALNWED